MKNIIVAVLAAMSLHGGVVLASGVPKKYAEYKNQIARIVREAEAAFKKSKGQAYNKYAEAKEVVDQARKDRLKHADIEALKKMVYPSIKSAAKSSTEIAELVTWFEPMTEEELEKIGGMSLDDIFKFQEI